MRCWRVRRLISDYRHNELPQEQSAQVEYHLVRCHKCFSFMEEERALIDLVVGALKLKKENLTKDERHIISAKMQSAMAILRKPKPSFKAKILEWLRKIGEKWRLAQRGLSLFWDCPRNEVRRMCLSPFSKIMTVPGTHLMPGLAIVVFLIGGFLFFHFQQSTLSSPKVSITTPNAQIMAGGNTQLYLNPEEDGSTRIGVAYAYDTVSVLTKRNNINLTSGTTAYVYPDGTISKPEQISQEQLKRWKGGKGTVPRFTD